MLEGRIHSIETMGMFDGPGIRTVFFLQGCPLRCKYCHNPDTWKNGGEVYSVEDIVNFAKRYKPYYKETGGVTFSGGEALMQGEFLLEAIKALKEENIHVTLDTCGVGQTQYFEKILDLVDLVMLDIKHFDKTGYKDLTGVSMKWSEKFISLLKNFKGDLWIRHVMVPGYTDSYKAMDGLLRTVLNIRNKIEKIEILPYHKLGVEKYSQLGMDYPFKDVPEMSKDNAKIFEDYIMDGLLNQSVAV